VFDLVHSKFVLTIYPGDVTNDFDYFAN